MRKDRELRKRFASKAGDLNALKKLMCDYNHDFDASKEEKPKTLLLKNTSNKL